MLEEQTIKTIEKMLSKKITFLPLGRRKAVLDLLDLPAFIYDSETIKYLFELVFDRDIVIVKKALDCIEFNINSFLKQNWIWLEQDFRSNYYYGIPRTRWFALKPSDVDNLERFEEHQTLVAGLLSFHNNGYVRETALNKLGKFGPTEKGLTFILLRANDWVPEIRLQVERVLMQMVSKENANYWLFNMPYLYRLVNCGRKNHQELIQAVEKCLAGLSDKAILYEALNSSEKITRRVSFELLWRTDENREKLLRLGLNHNDISIRKIAIKNASEAIDQIGADKMYEFYCKNKSAIIRVFATDLLEKCKEHNSIKELEGFLLDISLSVRESARYWLRKYLYKEFAQYYRNALNHSVTYGAICGLGETGEKEDSVLIYKFTNHPQAKLRRAAIHAIAKLDPKEHIELFINSLNDKSIGISKEGRLALQANINLVDEAKLWSIIEKQEARSYITDNVFYIFSKLPKWKSLIQLLRLFEYDYEGYEKEINDALTHWILKNSRGYNQPSLTESKKIKELLKDSDKLSSSNRAYIEFYLK